MNNEQAGTIYYDAIIETKNLKVTAAQAEKIVKDTTSKSSREVNKAGKDMSASFSGVAQSLAIVGSGYLSLRGASAFIGQSIADANRYQSSIAGLASVSRAFGQDTGSALQAAKDFAADGLIPLAQSTQAFKTALASGFSIEEATALLSGLKDQAVNNRQSFYDLGGAVNATLEGIKNGNSVLADATGTTKNLSVIAKEAGIGIDEMGSVSQNTAYRTAILNSFLQETSRSMGDSAKYADQAAGADARFATSMTNLRVEVGQVANALRQGAVTGLTEFISSNQEAIITIGSAVGASVAFAGGVYALTKALTVLRVAMTLIATHPIVAVLSLTVGLLAALTINNLMNELDESANTTEDMAGNIAKMPGSLNSSTKEATKLAKELAKIDDQVQKTNEQFREQLAELVQNKNDSIAELRDQLSQEQAAYDKSYSDRLYDFNESQQKELQSHQEKTDALQTQIDFLGRYNNASNRRRLSELQFTLARENAEFDKSNTERLSKYDQDAEAERLSYDKRRIELESRLTNETSLLERHRADVESIRGTILLDEIDKLKRSRDEQLKSLDQQRQDAVSNANQTMSDTLAAYGANRASFEAMGTELGNAIGDKLKKALVDALKAIPKAIFEESKPGGAIDRAFESAFGTNSAIGKAFQKAIGVGGRANGGPVSAGQPYIVGDNPDGSINRTSELFVPNRSGTIIPSSDLQGALGGGGTTNVTVNVSGTFATSALERRRVADQIVSAFNQTLRARGAAEIGA